MILRKLYNNDIVVSRGMSFQEIYVDIFKDKIS